MFNSVEILQKEVYTNHMNKMCILIENQNKIEDLEPAITELKAKGVEIFWGDKSCLLGIQERESGQSLDEENKVRDILVLTDVPQMASLLAAGGYPVLAYVHEGNKGEPLPFVKYVIEGFEDVDGEYFCRVWQRLTGKPWFITETERCIIRETTESDVDAFYEIYKEPSITQFMEPLFEEKEAELQYVKDYREKVYDFFGFGMWTLLDKQTGQVIGRAGISMREGFDDPELGFMIAKDYQGKGLATEVCQAILAFAYQEFQFSRFQALVCKDNLPSHKVLSKLGFSYVREERINDETLQLFIAQYSPSI